jgi:hypothetical protein
MSLADRLRWAIAPDQRRSLWIMYGIPMLAARLVAGCGMVGYLRWFFGAEVQEQRRR